MIRRIRKEQRHRKGEWIMQTGFQASYTSLWPDEKETADTRQR